jgi:hypothetical protein
MPNFDWYLTSEELADSIKKKWIKNAKKLRIMLEKSREMRLKYKKEEYVWVI